NLASPGRPSNGAVLGPLDSLSRGGISHPARRFRQMDRPKYEPVAEIEVDAARPDPQGFTLTGQGADHAEYQLDLHFGMPLDAKTRSVLGELLSHSDLTISDRKSTRLNSSHVAISYAV